MNEARSGSRWGREMKRSQGSVLVLALVVMSVVSLGAFALIEGVTMDADVASHAEQAAVAAAMDERALARAEGWLVANAFWIVPRCRESPGFSLAGGGGVVQCLDEVDERSFFRVVVHRPRGDARGEDLGKIALESTYAVGGTDVLATARLSWRRDPP